MTASNQQSQQSSAATNCIQTSTNLKKENFFKEIAKEKNVKRKRVNGNGC